VDNHALRQNRAAHFCAGVKDHYAATPKSYAKLIRSCEAAPADQYVGSNATRTDRAQNRSILIRRAAAKLQAQKENQGFPNNPKFGPSEAHCAAYATDLARNILGPVYTKNAHCSCMVTPDEPHSNCVRDCLQDKMWNLLANAKRDRKPNDPPMDINFACRPALRRGLGCDQCVELVHAPGEGRQASSGGLRNRRRRPLT
jgi:hypothetical protein